MTTNSYLLAKIRYLVPTGEKPIYIASQGGADAALSIGADFEEHEVMIHDARQLPAPATLDHEGFTLLAHPTEVTDFYALQKFQQAYEAEISDLVLPASAWK